MHDGTRGRGTGPDSRPHAKAPDGHKYRGECGDRLHGICGEVQDPDSVNTLSRICVTCLTAKAPAHGYNILHCSSAVLYYGSSRG